MKITLNKTGIAAGICALAVAVSAQNQPATPRLSEMNGDTNINDNMPLTAQSFVVEAAKTDQKEIHMGELALQKSDNADVKSFAREIIRDHSQSSKKLLTIAQRENLYFPDTNSLAWSGTNSMNENSGRFQNPPTEKQDKDSPPHLASLLVTNNTPETADQDMMNWNALSGAEFDRAFVSHMIAGHEKAIQKFETASTSLTDSNLKTYAQNTLPTLRKHLRDAQDLQSKIGGNAGSYNNPNPTSPNQTYPNQ